MVQSRNSKKVRLPSAKLQHVKTVFHWRLVCNLTCAFDLRSARSSSALGTLSPKLRLCFVYSRQRWNACRTPSESSSKLVPTCLPATNGNCQDASERPQESLLLSHECAANGCCPIKKTIRTAAAKGGTLCIYISALHLQWAAHSLVLRMSS
jgi:hypothetical protein